MNMAAGRRPRQFLPDRVLLRRQAGNVIAANPLSHLFKYIHSFTQPYKEYPAGRMLLQTAG